MAEILEPSSRKRKLAAILHADVVGFSRLMGEDEAGTHQALSKLRRAVDGLTYSVARGQTVAVIGESGSGKTVSSRAIITTLLLVAMPLWIATRTKAPLPLTGLLFTLNTVLVVLLQVRTSRTIAAREGITRSYSIAAGSFVLACGAFALAAGAPAFAAIVLLVVALGALTAAEMVRDRTRHASR